MSRLPPTGVEGKGANRWRSGREGREEALTGRQTGRRAFGRAPNKLSTLRSPPILIRFPPNSQSSFFSPHPTHPHRSYTHPTSPWCVIQETNRNGRAPTAFTFPSSIFPSNHFQPCKLSGWVLLDLLFHLDALSLHSCFPFPTYLTSKSTVQLPLFSTLFFPFSLSF
jgi:hypothetical protein